MIRVAITAAALIKGIGALDAETLTCSQWQDVHTCSGANGYVSHETQWQGMTIGEDNRGNRFTRSDWQGSGALKRYGL
jgi:hypothetical protein